MSAPPDENPEQDGRSDVYFRAGKKLFELVRPEAVALGGALLDRGVRAVMDGDVKIRIGAGPAPGRGRKRKRPEPEPAVEVEPEVAAEDEVEEDSTIIEADFEVSEPDEPVDEGKVETAAKASTIAVGPKPEAPKLQRRRVLPAATGPILGRKLRYRCRHCSGTWSEIKKLEKCPRCFEPDWQDGDPEEM
jgi:hypothetical protein